jgi:Na+/H+ antiporter NhaC
MENLKKGSIFGLLPLGVFLTLYLGISIYVNDFYKVPILVAMLGAIAVGFLMNPKVDFSKKIEKFISGIAKPDVITMLLIFILAGAFSGVAREIGAVESVVNFGLSILPPNLLIVGIFIIGCFISLSIGTSVGTIVALAPIAVGISEATTIALPLAIGAVVSGAMFGDNLSMISDTTIAATNSQGCSLKDKFLFNIKIVLPAALLTAIILFITSPSVTTALETGEYNLVKLIPYLFVLGTAIAGLNVFVILIGGIFLSLGIGIITGTGISQIASSINGGIMGMGELIILSMLVSGLVEIMRLNGGIDFILNTIKSRIKGKKGAQFGIALLVGLVNMCTANNTVAIVMTGPLAKDISDEFDIDPRKTASILDTFSCFFQGIIPYGAQLLFAASIAKISPLSIMRYLYYPYLMGICAIIAIAIIDDKKEAKKISVKEAA